jgi:hypothetical protein
MINNLTGANIELVAGPWKNIVEQAQRREIDGLAESGVIESRREYFQFTDPYNLVEYAAATLPEKAAGIHAASDLKGKRIAHLKGNIWTGKIIASIGDVQAIEARTEEEAFQAIRDGNQAHPINFTPFFWDYVAAGNRELDQGGEIYSIEKRMVKLGLSEAEMSKLSEAKKESDSLFNLETIAMNAVKGLYSGDDGRFTIKGEPDLKMARNLLYGKAYHEAKARIMKPIEQFFTLLQWRMTNEKICCMDAAKPSFLAS